MKRQYQEPNVTVVNVHVEQNLLAGSVTSLSTNDTGLKLGGGGSGDARSRDYDDWDED